MYFFSYQPLKEKLRAREVSDRESLPYLLAFLGMTSLAIATTSSGMTSGFWSLLSVAVSVCISIGGGFYAYICNGGKDGFDIVLKYIVLSWIVSVRWFFILFPLLIVGQVFGMALGLATPETGLFDVLLYSALEALIYQRIGRQIRDTRS